jgi:hypothetical protein
MLSLKHHMIDCYSSKFQEHKIYPLRIKLGLIQCLNTPFVDRVKICIDINIYDLFHNEKSKT